MMKKGDVSDDANDDDDDEVRTTVKPHNCLTAK
jgi:hypothetical protein